MPPLDPSANKSLFEDRTLMPSLMSGAFKTSFHNKVVMPSSHTKKVRIKNVKRLKNVSKTLTHYEPATFPIEGRQRSEISVKKICKEKQSSRSDTVHTEKHKQLLKLNQSNEVPDNGGALPVKRSNRIKERKKSVELYVLDKLENDNEESSDVSSLSEITSSDVKNIPVENKAIGKHVFKSKRLQELQERVDNQTVDTLILTNKNSEAAQKVVSKLGTEELQTPIIEKNNVRLKTGKPRNNVEQPNSMLESQARQAVLKRRAVNEKKGAVTRLQAISNGLPSSSEDEESTKPLSQIKKEMEKKEETPPKRVVKKVIKVVRKIKTKSGETKTKVVKIIKRIGVRKKKLEGMCPVVPGKRRARCGKCEGCLVTEDCGICRWCK